MKTIIHTSADCVQLVRGTFKGPRFLVLADGYYYKCFALSEKDRFDRETDTLRSVRGIEGICQAVDSGRACFDTRTGTAEAYCIKLPHYGKDLRKIFNTFTSNTAWAERDSEALAIFGTAQSQALMDKILRCFLGLEANGILHNDIAPANIILDESLSPVIIDLGSAIRLTPGESLVLGEDDLIEGHKDFISPDKGELKIISYASDVYSLGKVFHEMIRIGSDFYKIAYPASLVNWVKRCMSPVMEERFPTIADMAEAFHCLEEAADAPAAAETAPGGAAQAISATAPAAPTQTTVAAKDREPDRIQAREHPDPVPARPVIVQAKAAARGHGLGSAFLSALAGLAFLLFATSAYMAVRPYSEDEMDALEHPSIRRDLQIIISDIHKLINK